MPDSLLEFATFVFPTDLGWTALAWKDNRLCRMTFGHPSASAAEAHLGLETDWAPIARSDLPAWVADLVERVQAYAGGEQVTFDDVQVDLSHLTAFQQKVVRACRKIRRGRTRTYGELAATVGSPGASRAVGSVMAKNRLPVIVPCHRVVGAGRSLGGFSAPEGLGMKQRMLALEGVLGTLEKPRNTGTARKKAGLSRLAL